MKEALATGSEAWWRTKTGPEWIREKDGNYRVTFWWRDPQKRNTLPDTACLGLHHWRNRSSSKRAASDDGAYCRNGCLALEHGA